MPICYNHSGHFFCGQDNLLGGQFWAMGRFNLLGGPMPIQLTIIYLPGFQGIKIRLQFTHTPSEKLKLLINVASHLCSLYV